jgi:hypothetical protein
MKQGLLLISILTLILVVSGCTNPLSDENILESAYDLCKNKAVLCSEGIPAVAAAFQDACFEIYYYTGNTTMLLDFTRDMC